MTIGQRILEARTALGMSQRDLAGTEITRNMLSALEHDKAKPSLDTLEYLSEKLCRPMSWLLGEDVPQVDGLDGLRRARSCYDQRKFRECLEVLEQIPSGEVLCRETQLLCFLAKTDLAEQALEEGRIPYARKLLETVELSFPYCSDALMRRYRLLRARAAGKRELAQRVQELGEDDSLLLRARAALEVRQWEDAQRYLDALDRRDSTWHYLMGEVKFARREFAEAARCYHQAEPVMGKALRKRLQLCYAELGDFEKAYRYATME